MLRRMFFSGCRDFLNKLQLVIFPMLGVEGHTCDKYDLEKSMQKTFKMTRNKTCSEKKERTTEDVEAQFHNLLIPRMRSLTFLMIGQDIAAQDGQD